MQAHNVDIDCYVNLEDAESDATMQRVLAAHLPEQVITRTLQAVGIVQAVMLTLVISDDEEIQALNRQYRQQDRPTDVLSFPLLDKPLVDAPTAQLWMGLEEAGAEQAATKTHPTFVTPPELATNLGDIVISWPTVL